MEVVNKLCENILLEMTLFFCAATSSNSLSPCVRGGGHDTPLYSLGYRNDIKYRYDIIKAPSNVLYLIHWLFCCCASAWQFSQGECPPSL